MQVKKNMSQNKISVTVIETRNSIQLESYHLSQNQKLILINNRKESMPGNWRKGVGCVW